MANEEPLLQLDGVHCGYDAETVVKDLSFHVNPGDIACLLGPSGCGKTTTLRAVAGFEPVLAGTISLAGEPVSRPNRLVPPEKRSLGMVFQDYALFPHLSIADNVSFGLRQASGRQRAAVAAKMLELVGLESYARRYPHELSGGQQQRVALARAMAPEPRLILMDEPFSNLDVDLRRRLSQDVRDILKSLGTTALMVTHDQEEAFAVADRVGVMKDGGLQQWDTPYNIYHEPLNRFVANFIGLGHFIRGKALSPELVDTEMGIIQGNRAYQWPADSPVDILLRPDDILPDPESPLQAKVLHKTFTGAYMLFQLQLPTGSIVEALFPSHNDYAVGEMVGIRLEADHLVAFPSPTA
ncbi:MAG: iron ABC transporter ATP-binding protein [Pseudomonadales bacterium]|nr:iron ABC transporter ATP-binding protein [Pseudomonadales bacterium]